MSSKYKIIVLTVVGLAVLALLIASNLALFAPDEVETVPEDGQFKPIADPHSAYLEAVAEGKPTVIKFYARW